MTPAFRIEGETLSVSGDMDSRLVSLTVTDEPGLSSDEVAVVLDNRGHHFAVPEKGVRLKVSLGYTGALIYQGLFIVHHVETRGPNLQLRFRAGAADLTKELKVKRSAAYVDMTIGEIVSEVAARHDLEPAVSPEISGLPASEYPYEQVDQTNENDLHFLRRLAVTHGCVFKPHDGRLIFFPEGDEKSVSGKALPAIEITQSEVTSWGATAPDRTRYKSTSATYVDPVTMERQEVTSGDGAPVFRITELQTSQEVAQRAVDAKLIALQRSDRRLTFRMPGRAELRAEAPVKFISSDALASGDWIVQRAVHELSNAGFTSAVELEAPAP